MKHQDWMKDLIVYEKNEMRRLTDEIIECAEKGENFDKLLEKYNVALRLLCEAHDIVSQGEKE